MDPEVNELSGSGEVPLAFRMMENLPTISASLGFANNRAANTLLRGGYMDDRMMGRSKFNVRGKNVKNPFANYMNRFGNFQDGALHPTKPTSRAYYGSSARRSRLAQAAGTSEGKMVLGKAARVNHLSARPRNLTRYSSLTMFNPSETSGYYSPFQMMYKAAGGIAKKNAGFMKEVYGDRKLAEGENVFARGTLSMITAGRKADLLERKAAFSATGQAENRAARKVLKAQEQTRRLANMGNPIQAQNNVARSAITRNLNSNMPVGMRGSLPDRLDQARRLRIPVSSVAPSSTISYTGFGAKGVDDIIAARGQSVGLTGNLMASSGGTAGTRYVTGYARGALGFADAGGLTDDALKGAQKAVQHMEKAIFKGIGSPSAHLGTTALKEGVFKTLGVKGTFKAAMTAERSKSSRNENSSYGNSWT